MIHSIYPISKKNNFFPLMVCIGISLLSLIFSEPCAHWFMIPITLCGLLLAKDAQNWFTGKLDMFNPAGVIAFLGFYFFYLTPILHVSWDVWIRDVSPPKDWRLWLGYMGILNLIGLVIYKVTSSNKILKRQMSLRKQWILDENRFWVVGFMASLVSLGFQIYVFRSFGGVLEYINAFEAGSDEFRGMGWIFLISESFPIIAFMAYAVSARKNKFARRWSVIFFVIFLFIGLRILFGGMRGSRGNTIWALFWAVGIIHIWVRKLNRNFIYVGLISIIAFMYSFGLYKSYGLIGLSSLSNPIKSGELAQKSGRTMDRMLLGDLGRSDIQAYLLYSITDQNNDYRYKWGQTYLGSLMLLLPKQIRPDVIDKQVAGTEAQYGFLYPEKFLSTRIYGLAGEAMLNWGIVSIPVAFALYGLVVSTLRNFFLSIPKNDVRALFMPFLINMVILMLISDSDNLVYSFVKNGSLPFLVMLLTSKRISTCHGKA